MSATLGQLGLRGALGGASTGGLTKAALIARLTTLGVVSCYLPSEYATTAWRRYDATTEIGMIGYPVGFLGDMLQGMALGPELVTNGDFSQGTAGWSPYFSTISVADGVLKVTTTSGSVGYAYQPPVALGVPAFFAVDGQSINGTGDASAVIDGALPANSTGFAIVRATTASIKYYRRNVGSAGTYSFHDGCSMRRVLGNHSLQATDGNRPSLLSDGRVYYLSHASGQRLMAYVPSSLGATCTIVYASPGVGAQVLYDVPVTANVVELTQNHSGLAILPSTATPDQVSIATMVMNQLAWRTVV